MRAAPLILVLSLPLLLAACGDTRAYYEARCAERFGLQRGTPELAACVAREERIVEETQARARRAYGSP